MHIKFYNSWFENKCKVEFSLLVIHLGNLMPWASAIAVTHLPGSVFVHDWLNSELGKKKYTHEVNTYAKHL